jgi:diguanylate cyclase (GGDEF)-like protein
MTAPPLADQVHDDLPAFRQAITWALTHGWTRAWGTHEIELPDGDGGYAWIIDWDTELDDAGRRRVWVIERTGFGDRVTELRFASTAQAIEVLAPLTGHGHELTAAHQLRTDLHQLADALAESQAESIAAAYWRVLALHDALTALPNRRAITERLADRIASGDGGHVLFLDLDGFKQINDTYGHATGDEAIITVANRLTQADGVRCMIGRMGGDEFVALFDADQDPATAAQALADAVAETSMTVSVGIASITESDRCPDEVLRRADTAMYEAKRAKRQPEGNPLGRREIRDHGAETAA